MNDIKRSLLEAKDVNIYKKLLNVLGEWTDKFPASGVDNLLEILIEKGKKLLPKDKRALDILDYIFTSNSESVSAAVQQLLNTRFLDLPVDLKPVTKSGRRYEVAFWHRDGQVLDKVKDLIDFTGKGGAGFWCDVNGGRIQLLDSKE
jgi:hypothetical protein